VTITLPVFNNAKTIRVVVTGADKAEAVATAIMRTKVAYDFPVCGVRVDDIVWMMDTPCAGML
jgi:6-phosphogluconolactonase/glucosamine-6-phosphate isomerase/deaminase